MATRIITSSTLVGQAAIQYIREQTLTLTLSDARPNTKMYIFFDGENVTDYCRNMIIGEDGTPTGISDNTDVLTDGAGQAIIAFEVPGNTYNTGSREIIVTDAADLASLDITGSVFGSAKTKFEANGILEIFQSRITAVHTTVRYIPPPPPPRMVDPLAQSFFTYGVPGGIFLSSIDLFFQTKDDNIPVSVELRPMVNGYPGPLPSGNPSLVSSMNPADVNVSSDASAATKFKFEPPVYLKEDQDFCFVVRSNSKYYNIFTSRMGERSFENKLKIFEQPYVGSIFKSENDITWSAEQTDDIKFTINKAVFNTAIEPTLQFAAVVPPVAAFGRQFTTTAGSNLVKYRHAQEHGLKENDKLHITANTGNLYANASLNGIPYSEFAGEKTVVAVYDRNTVGFNVSSAATLSGTIDSADVITGLDVVSGGTNYTSAATIEFGGLPSVAAEATLDIVGGVIKGVTLTNSGIGYSKAPIVSVNRNVPGQVGTAAVITATVQAAFSVTANKPMTGMNPKIVVSNYGSTSTVNTATTTIGNYDGGSLTWYEQGKSFDFTPMFPYANINQSSLVASSYNEELHFGTDQYSTTLSMKLKTTNANLSPVINLNVRPTLNAYYSRINAQPGETLTATNYSGGLIAGTYPYDVNGTASNGTVNITNQGGGYEDTPTVVISAPDYPEGIQATATASLSGEALGSITIVNGGSGYINTPTITIVKAEGTNDPTTNASVRASLTPFNTELRATGGNAKARYLTKKTNLKVTSTGVRLIATISSVEGASVDWYIRTSVSGSGVHEEQPWRILSCDSPRNKSSYIGEMYDYEFKLDDIPPFNTYDLKCVLLAQDPTKAPIVDAYRVIVVA